jgi:hypothetical protein
MANPTTRIIRQLKWNIADYAVTYYKVHGRNPVADDLSSIVRNAIDQEEDPFIRVCLRKGVRVARAEYAEGDCALTFGLHKETFKKLKNYLA